MATESTDRTEESIAECIYLGPLRVSFGFSLMSGDGVIRIIPHQKFYFSHEADVELVETLLREGRWRGSVRRFGKSRTSKKTLVDKIKAAVHPEKDPAPINEGDADFPPCIGEDCRLGGTGNHPCQWLQETEGTPNNPEGKWCVSPDGPDIFKKEDVKKPNQPPKSKGKGKKGKKGK